MNVKTFVVEVRNYTNALLMLDEKVNDFLGTYGNSQRIVVSGTDIQDTLYPPIKNGDFPRLARRVVFKTIYRT